MNSAKLLSARKYYDAVSSGKDKKETAMAIYGNKNIKRIEESEEYQQIVVAASQVEREQLRTEIEQVKRRQLKSYNKLLDKSEELMDEAKTTEDKLLAQKNHRANLGAGVVESTADWMGEDRNKTDLGDILEGVIA